MIIIKKVIHHLTWLLATLLATLLQSMYKNYKITWKLNGLICCGKAITTVLKALCLVKINVLKYLKDAIILWLHLSASLKILHLPIVWSVDNYCCMKKKFQNLISLKEAALRKLECEVYEAQHLLKLNP